MYTQHVSDSFWPGAGEQCGLQSKFLSEGCQQRHRQDYQGMGPQQGLLPAHHHVPQQLQLGALH